MSEIPLDLQPKLLRALEERRFTRVGGTHEISVDLRIIAATNRSLEKAVTDGRFRKDLFFRLNIFPISVPPLRNRETDIPALARHLVSRIATQYHMPDAGLSEEALKHLFGYSWPGNVRELRNVLERGLLLAEGGVVGVEHLPTELAGVPCGMGPACACEGSLGQQTEAFQRGVILAALRQAGWRKKDAARELGLSPRALSHYLGKFNLEQERG